MTTVCGEFLPNSGLKASQNLNFPGNRLNIDVCLYLCVPALYVLGECSLITFLSQLKWTNDTFPSDLYNMELECL